MAGKYEFDAEIKKHPSLNSGFIEFPYDAMEQFGKNRVKVKALIDSVAYRGSLVRMGSDCHWLGITKEIRKATGKEPGDMVHVVIEEDKQERTVEIPADLLEMMKKEKEVFEFFNRLSFTHKKEYVRWIMEAKKEETRQRRLVKAIEMMKKDIKTPDQGKKVH